jgi:hypothetical protein
MQPYTSAIPHASFVAKQAEQIALAVSMIGSLSHPIIVVSVKLGIMISIQLVRHATTHVKPASPEIRFQSALVVQ